jgi:hypothetical protein
MESGRIARQGNARRSNPAVRMWLAVGSDLLAKGEASRLHLRRFRRIED